MWLSRLGLLCILCGGACQPYQGAAASLPDPELTIAGRKIVPDSCDTALTLSFVLKNPRLGPIVLDRWQADVSANGQALPAQSEAMQGEAPSQQELAFALPLHLRLHCEALLEHAQIDKIAVRGRILGRAGKGAKAEELLFEFEDAFELQAPRVPDLVAELRTQKYDNGRVDVFLQLKVHNGNPFTLSFDVVSYAFSLEGNEVARGEFLSKDKLRENAETQLEVPVELDPKRGSPFAELAKRRRSGYQVTAAMSIGGVSYPFEKHGELRY